MIKEESKALLFDLFWENTNLNDKNMLTFVGNFENEESDVERIKYSTTDLKLKYPNDKLFKIMTKRYSGREYNNYQLNEKELASLFSCFAEIKTHRLLPSAGGKYPIEVYAMCFNVRGLSEKIVYYDYVNNSLSVIGKCGIWKDIEPITGTGGTIKGNPSIMFLFVGFPNRVISKYGERGGRFLLIESGHYLQNLSLRIANENLCGVELGGLYDNDIKKYLGLENVEAIITLGLICGK